VAYTNDYIGALYGISIIAFSGEMREIFAALDAAGINYNAAESSDSQVFVVHDHVGRAVAVINGLGYETDEDEE